MSRVADAEHEAGHVVVALALGIEVALATIGDHRGRGACVDLDDDGSAGLEAQAMVRLAGKQALVGFGDTSLPGAEVGCLKDLDEARVLALTIASGDEGRALVVLDELRAQVDALLLEHNGELGRVTVALLERLTLSSSEVREIIAAGGRRSLS